MREDGDRLHAKLEPLVQVGTVQHAATDVVLGALVLGNAIRQSQITFQTDLTFAQKLRYLRIMK